LFVTNDSALADNEGIIVIYDNNNYTVPHTTPSYELLEADVHWATVGGSDENIFSTIQIAKHETYLHAMFDGIHSPDSNDNFHGPPSVAPQPYEEYLIKIERNKVMQNLKGYRDVNE